MTTRHSRRPPSRAARALALASADLRDRFQWSQRQLAARARVSQAAIWRIESGRADDLDLGVNLRVMDALGARVDFDVRAPVIPEDRRLRDPVHAVMGAYAVRRLARDSWVVRQEVEIRSGQSVGWIDLLGYREEDGALLVGELKTTIVDIGGAQRQVQWYAREAWAAARALGWQARSVSSALIVLDTTENAEVLRAHKATFADAFPTRARDLLAAIRGESEMPGRPALAMVDPLSRRAQWLRATPNDGRRTPAPYADYAAVAERITRRRRSG